MDPDPGGPKSCGSGGSGSVTLGIRTGCPREVENISSSVGDPDLQDSHVFGPAGSESLVRATDPAPDLPFSHRCVERSEKMSAK